MYNWLFCSLYNFGNKYLSLLIFIAKMSAKLWNEIVLIAQIVKILEEKGSLSYTINTLVDDLVMCGTRVLTSFPIIPVSAPT